MIATSDDNQWHHYHRSSLAISHYGFYDNSFDDEKLLTTPTHPLNQALHLYETFLCGSVSVDHEHMWCGRSKCSLVSPANNYI